MKNVDELANELFLSAMDLAPRERAAYLAKMCCDSSELRARVDSMLERNDQAGSFLMHPVLGTGHDAYKQEPAVTTEVPTPLNAVPHISPQYKPQFKSGDVLMERFLVVRFIASGGMGEVYEVEDRQLRGVHVALKTILSQYATDTIMQGRFEREVLHAREVVHSNVCPIYDIFHWKRAEGELIFLTMKLLPGETLASRLHRLGKLPPEEVSKITRQVTAGLSAAHEAGILHRDIKPANIILGGSEKNLHAYVTDFGLARPFVDQTTTLTTGLAGTPGYVAPELFCGSAPSKASDVFSLGVVIYQMLCGHLPEVAEVWFKNKKAPQLDHAVPSLWKAPLERSLHPDLAVRFKDIPEFAASLPQLNDGDDNSRPAFRGVSRRTIVIAGASGLTAAITGGIWFGWDNVLNLFEPLPLQRFVALMAWPSDGQATLVITILDEIGEGLRRTEARAKNLLVYSISEVINSKIPILLPQDAGKALGATLVLAASLQNGAKVSHLDLQLLDVASQNVLRHATLTFDPKDVAVVSEKASRAAIRMFGLQTRDSPKQDSEELSRVSPAVFEVFSQAQAAAAEPNNAGLEKAILLFQKAVDLDSQFALGYAELAITYVRRFNAGGDAANVALAEANSKLALHYNANSATALLGAALARVYSGDSKKAMDYFTRALETDRATRRFSYIRRRHFGT